MLMRKREIKDSLERLDKLTREESQLASAEQLRMTQGVDDRVRGVGGQVQDVDDRVQVIDNNVRGANDKLDQANRSLSYQSLIIVLCPQPAIQGTSSETISCDGSHPQIHPQIITSHAKRITAAQLDGFSKEVYSIIGNQLAPSCGYTENVCYP